MDTQDGTSAPQSESRKSLQLAARIWMVSLIILLILGVVPSTRWVLSQQIRWLFGKPHGIRVVLTTLGATSPDAEKLTPDDLTRIKTLSTGKDADYQVQLGSALSDGSCGGAIALRSLSLKYPNQTSAIADYLNYSTGCNSIRLNRDKEEYGLTGSPVPKPGSEFYFAPNPPPTPAQFSEFDSMALRGEKIDPDNAYFPVLRAVGMLAVHHDSDAVTQINRAGKLSGWNDYTDENIDALVTAHQSIFGRTSVIEDSAVTETVLFPFFASVRAETRVATYFAIQDEHSGHIEQGFELRKSLMHTGALMRTQSSSVIGNLVGMAIVSIPSQRPGGGPHLVKPKKMTVDQWTQARRDMYINYLIKIHHTRDANWVKNEFINDDNAKAITHQGLQSPYFPWQPQKDITLSWLFSMIVLSNIIWFTLIGIIVTPISKLDESLQIQRLESTVFFTVLSFVVLIFMIANLSTWAKDVSLLWQDFTQMMSAQNKSSDGIMFTIAVIPFFAAPVLPVVCTLALTIFAAVKRRPLAKLSAQSIPYITLILVLVYVVGISITSGKESRSASQLSAYHQGEGQYLAKAMGKPWPGVTPDTSAIFGK